MVHIINNLQLLYVKSLKRGSTSQLIAVSISSTMLSTARSRGMVCHSKAASCSEPWLKGGWCGRGIPQADNHQGHVYFPYTWCPSIDLKSSKLKSISYMFFKLNKRFLTQLNVQIRTNNYNSKLFFTKGFFPPFREISLSKQLEYPRFLVVVVYLVLWIWDT